MQLAEMTDTSSGHSGRLASVGAGIWTSRHPLTVGGLALGTRTTVVQLGDGSLLLHSPGPVDAELRRALDGLGPVSHIVAPNRLHHGFVRQYAQAYPEARVLAVAGAREKLALAGAGLLDTTAERAWSDVLEQIPIGGIPTVDEMVFFHRPSATLILADLCFNLQSSESWFTRTMMRLNGGWQRFGPTRLMRSAIKDPSLTRQGVERVLQWPIAQVSVCHGEIVTHDGREALSCAFSFLKP